MSVLRPVAVSGPRLVEVDWAECVHCGVCTGVCAPGALSLDRESWELQFRDSLCTGCGACVPACPVGAIREASHA